MHHKAVVHFTKLSGSFFLLLLSTICLKAQVTNINKPVVGMVVPPAPSGTKRVMPAAYAAGTKLNYVRSWDALGPFTDANTFTNQPYSAVRQTTSYLDGLGRLLQTVVRQATPGSAPTDIVSSVVYDEFGREPVKYMPYSSSGTDGNFRLNPFAEQHSALQAQYPGESVFYGKTDFEASPLNRPLKTYAPGNSWAGSNKGVEQQYLINTLSNDVKIWTIGSDINNFDNNIPAVMANPYLAGQLYQTKTIDENGNAIVEFKDKEGKVILKKVQAGATVTDAVIGWLCTYYIYDDLGNLRFVVPPKAVTLLSQNGWSFSNTQNAIGTDIANELCFRYEYDARNRMVAKKVPGAGWVYMVYDSRDRLVFMQDANMRLRKQWLATLYDALNRPVLTGMVVYSVSGTDNAIWTALQGNVTTKTTNTPVATSNDPSIPVVNGDLTLNTLQADVKYYKYSNSITLEPGFITDNTSNVTLAIENTDNPVTTDITTIVNGIAVCNSPLEASFNFIALTITYYDNYAFNTNTAKKYAAPSTALTAGTSSYPVVSPNNTEQAQVPTNGMVTGTMVRTLPNSEDLSAGIWLGSVIYYDDRGRVIQTYSDNYKGGIDKSTNLYNFTGAVLCSRLEHSNPQNTDATLKQITVQTNIKYDAAGRLLEVAKSINGATAKIISTNSYDQSGQLSAKELGQNIEGMLDYTYNVRGWLKSINKDFTNGVTSSGRSFGMELSYDWGFDKNQLNGNIAGAKWRSKGDKVQRAYGFGYDRVNRLLYADFGQGAAYAKDPTVNFSMNMGTFTNGVFTEGSAYDENGNILAMSQYGLKINSSPVIDNLTYSYHAGSNKLKNISEASGINDPLTKLGDFRVSKAYMTAMGDPEVKPVTAKDYDYDLNGNLTQDLNKDIDISAGATQGIQYNHLNLPWKINVKNMGTITYTYDAAGNKLEKLTTNLLPFPDGKPNPPKTTTYLGGFVYENNVLQFFGTEEGRVRVVPSSTPGANTFAFDYFIKDHLGNTRAVLTDEVQKDEYLAATLEEVPLELEKKYYNLPDVTRVKKADIAGYPKDTYTTPNDFICKLDGKDGGTKVGSSIVLKVMVGDNFNIKVSSWYKTINGTTPDKPTSPLLDLVSALSSGIVKAASAGGHALAGPDLLSADVLKPNLRSFLNDPNKINPVTTRPKAYLNWILLDEQFKYVAGSSGAEQVPEESVYGNQSSTPIVNGHVKDNLPITQSGYLYIYVSNETPNINVFFDNLQVTHNRGALLEETHYYPFGLTMAGISSKAEGKLQNKYGITGKEKQSQEFSDGSGLETYDFSARFYDPQIGRFSSIDPHVANYYWITPYNYCNNNPIKFLDPSGMDPEKSTPENPKRLDEVTVTAPKNVNNSLANRGLSWANNATTPKARHSISTLSDKGNNQVPTLTNANRCPSCLDFSTIGNNIHGLSYAGGNNPKSYNLNYNYSYVPKNAADFPPIGHDRRYDNLGIKGASGLFFNTKSIGADWKFVGEELQIALFPPDPIAQADAWILGIGLGISSLPKTIVQLNSGPTALMEIQYWYEVSNKGVDNTPK